MEERINMIFVPMRGGIAIAMRASGVLFFTDTNAGEEVFISSMPMPLPKVLLPNIMGNNIWYLIARIESI